MTTRETIMAALFARLAAIDGLASSSRRLRHWADVPAEDQPALFLAQRTGGVVERVRGQPSRLTLRADAYLYVRTDESTLPATILNDLLDAVAEALEPESEAFPVQTLGGVVHHCWIDGEIETDEGTLGDQAVAIVPITIIVNR